MHLDIALPPCIEAWLEDVDVSGASAVLFGSRADGCAHADSDWDVALIGGGDDLLGKFRYPYDCEVNIVHFAEEEFANRAAVYPGLPFEVAHTGRPLVAQRRIVLPIRPESCRMDAQGRSRDFRRFVTGSLMRADHFLMDVETCSLWGDLSATAWPGEMSRISVPPPSAAAAEFAVKALCVATGNTYAHVHKLDELADNVPPRWRTFVRALNGGSHRDHLAVYGGQVSSPARCVKRVIDALNLLAELVRYEPLPLFVADASEMRTELKRLMESASRSAFAERDVAVVQRFHAALSQWMAKLRELERGATG